MSERSSAAERAPGSAGAPEGRVLLAWLRERTGEMTDLLGRLASAESPSLDPQAQREAREILEGELSGLGLSVERPARTGGRRPPAGPSPSRRDGEPIQLLLGHLDTVWPVGTLATMPVRIGDGLLYGPGVFDMKGGLVQMIFALRALAERGVEPGLPPVVLVSADEEIGSRDSRKHVERLAREAAQGLGAGALFGPAGKLKTARKGVGSFTLTVRGVASHAGLDPEAGVSAILEVSHQVQRLFALNDSDRGITVNVGTIDGGLAPQRDRARGGGPDRGAGGRTPRTPPGSSGRSAG